MKQDRSFIVSIDVEDWPQSTWDRSLEITPRAATNTEHLLDLLREHGTTATMFILGKFAEKFPALVRRIAEDGHEVASHGYGHVEIFKQTRAEFQSDVSRSRSFLEDMIGKPILGYRAPDFSIIPSSLWALEVLAEEGFQYDSSIFPIRHGRYGIAEWPDHPVRVKLPSGKSIVELPIATVTAFGRRFPVAGGGYHRLLPSRMIRMLVASVLKRGDPFVSYCHPYEFDAKEFEEIDLDIPFTTRLHQGLGRRGFRLKFEDLIDAFPVTHAIAVASRSWPEHPVHSIT